MKTEPLPDIVERVRLVPDRHRVFDHDTSTVSKIYRIDAQVLSDLLDLGFPHRLSGGERYFDELDLANTSLALRTPSPRYLAMRRWPQIFRAMADDNPVRYEVEVAAECGLPASGHECDFRPSPRLLALGATATAAHRFTLRREVGNGRTGQAPARFRGLFAEVSRFRFHILPVSLFGDLGFLTETSLANCELGSRYLVQRATEEGWEARLSYGLLLSSPYSLHHFWPEFRVDGVWAAFDPYLILSLERWGVLTPGEVPIGQALDSAVFRVDGDWVDLLEDAGHPAPVSLLTRRRPLTGGAASVAGAVS
ncbi:hypothetical protein [Actinoplanes utahensis]|uniref:Transglutaminase-like domain-containing protein n=1 Tax=Actinoplanes utahensis TaxID=1869 RepID=A0A0A6UNK7_ACTUT|nr:hypothetical protein [Actinoplanes utahensis]KHD77011.1 hypothetical protein MB27_12865 [Actinoplanes utahensis]GIF33151.1 hypothetical protein Aut01nite_61370 [Actinoplanes utahensis]